MSSDYSLVIQELNRLFTDDVFKRSSAERLVKAKYVWETRTINLQDTDVLYQHTPYIMTSSLFFVKPGVKYHWGQSNTLPTIFGRVSDNYTRYSKPDYIGRKTCKARCGIEILGLQPLATERTYSNKCAMTIQELKEACKKNAIKIKSGWKKQDMLYALMKV